MVREDQAEHVEDTKGGEMKRQKPVFYRCNRAKGCMNTLCAYRKDVIKEHRPCHGGKWWGCGYHNQGAVRCARVSP